MDKAEVDVINEVHQYAYINKMGNGVVPGVQVLVLTYGAVCNQIFRCARLGNDGTGRCGSRCASVGTDAWGGVPGTKPCCLRLSSYYYSLPPMPVFLQNPAAYTDPSRGGRGANDRDVMRMRMVMVMVM
eukprot:937247-Rhodomonas_salina.1